MPKAFLIGVRRKGPGAPPHDPASLEELGRLAETAGITPAGAVTAAISKPHPATLIGSGKAEELASAIKETGAVTALFDEELTGAQNRNLEKALGVPVIDRTFLILEIFSQRARTREGQLQVKLARLSYKITRLTGRGVSMGQQQGMIGGRGPGERKIEYERRTLRDRITALQEELEAVRRERATQRGGRGAVPMAQVSIVGYTNAGKSTLLNALTGGQKAVYADDKLFATLDPTTRRVRLPSGGWALFTDTVGFIRKLPHQLVAAFRATLEEISFSDLILHVHDLSAPDMEAQARAVEATLAELELKGIPVLHVFNKADAAGPGAARLARPLSARDLLGKRAPRPAGAGPAVSISALKGEGLDRLLKSVEGVLSRKWKDYALALPLSQARFLDEIYGCCMVKEADYGPGEVTVRFRATEENYRKLLRAAPPGARPASAV